MNIADKQNGSSIAADGSMDQRRPYSRPLVVEPTSPESLNPRAAGRNTSDTPSNNKSGS